MLRTAQNFQQENENWKDWYPKRGEIFLVRLDDGMDSEMRGLRPFAILSNNIGNVAGTILVGCSITSRSKGLHRIHVPVGKEEGLKFDNCYLMTEHIRSVSKRRFFGVVGEYPVKVGELSEKKLAEVEKAIMFELGFGNNKLII